MALTIVEDDLFNVPADTRVISINLVGAMGAGVARTARNTVPGLMKHYRKMYPTIEPGNIIVYKHEDIRYFLVPTKLDWRDPSPRGLVIHHLNKIAVLAQRHRLGRIVMPPLGCGHGGLSWEDDISYVCRALYPFCEADFTVALGDARRKNGKS
ncbi:hypothetical protein D3C76_154660 [compost metagenome]